ncbi:hypothetical protein E8E13_003785 [Curvularia kusanoi]|uniref:Uncharacterized protein n=1 Tax=Curvularia kusanoi TaxID=90978 RepID=A0A9P4TG07_CURKU|nr:hypothetical protein E8E13_003785 [Curvularia kusanoi]
MHGVVRSACGARESIQFEQGVQHRSSQTPAKQRTVKISEIVDIICRHAFAHGLDDEALDAVIHIAARKTELDQTRQGLELSRGLGNEPALQGLLRVYKDYYPDIILGSASTSRKSFAPQPDAEWQARNSVTLEGIDSVEIFVEKLDSIEPPGQLVSFLTDPLLQKYVELKPSPVVSARIGLWLAACLEEQASAAIQGTGDIALLAELFNALLQHARYTKTLLPVVPAFLKEYISVWNGRDNVDAILGLLAYVPGDSFEDVHSEYLAPIERALSGNGLSSCVHMVDLYAGLLQHRVALLAQQEPEHRQPALSSPSQQFLKDSVSHFANLSTSLVLSLPPQMGYEVVSAVLSYWELLSTSSKPHVIPILLPPMHLVYQLLQSPSAAVVSRICGIIGNYKQAFDAHPRPVKHFYPSEVTDGLNWCLRDIYNLFWVARGLAVVENKSVGMYCDPALRSSLNDYLTGHDPEHAIGHIFNLSNNAWLTAMSSAAWQALEDQEIDRAKLDRGHVQRHTGPVSQQSLAALRDGGVSVDWEGVNGYKVYVLNWLAERGLGGLRELMFATVTDLKSGQANTT